MNSDLELETWCQEWQREAPVLPELRRRVERESRWLRAMRLSEIAVTLVFGGGTILWAIRSARADVWALASFTWIFIAVAWVFSLLNTHALSSPAAESNSEFIDLSIRRCRAQIRSTLFSAALYLFNLAYTLTWVYRAQAVLPLGAFLRSWNVCVVWGATLIFFGWLVWHRRRKQAELSQLLNLRDEPGSSMLN
jgi:hypothetical protein